MGKLILIAGVSRSGKSSFAEAIASAFESSIHIEQDKFVKAEKDIPKINGRTNWELPESINKTKWNEALEKALEQSELVVAEGIFAFQALKWIEHADLTLLLESTKEEYLARRKQERRWGPEPDWYLEYVWQAHLQYHNPYGIQPDLTFSNWTNKEVDEVIRRIKD